MAAAVCLNSIGDPRPCLESHSADILGQLEQILAENLTWLHNHLDEVTEQLRKGISLASIIKTPRRQLGIFAADQHKAHTVGAVTPEIFRDVLSGQLHSSIPLTPQSIPYDSHDPQLELVSKSTRPSNVSSVEDEAAIEASLLGNRSPVFRHAAASKLATSDASPMVLSKECPKSPKLNSTVSVTKSNLISPPRASPRLKAQQLLPATPPSPRSPIGKHASSTKITALANPPQFQHTQRLQEVLIVDTEIDQVDTLDQSELALPTAESRTSRNCNGGGSTRIPEQVVAPSLSAKAVSPSPISAFLSSHSSRPSALSFKGLPSREKSLGLLSKTQFSGRINFVHSETSSQVLNQSDSQQIHSNNIISLPDGSLKRKSDMIDIDCTMDRHSKLFKTDLTATSMKNNVSAPQNRIEALKSKVESMSKSLGARRTSVESSGPSTTLASSAQPYHTAKVAPSTLPRPISPVSRSPLRQTHVFGIPSSPAPRFGMDSPNTSSRSPIMQNAFRVFTHHGTSNLAKPGVQNDSPCMVTPAMDTIAQQPSLVRQSSVTNLVKAFESRIPANSNTNLGEGIARSPMKKLLRAPDFRSIVESTTPPNSPPTLIRSNRSCAISQNVEQHDDGEQPHIEYSNESEDGKTTFFDALGAPTTATTESPSSPKEVVLAGHILSTDSPGIDERTSNLAEVSISQQLHETEEIVPVDPLIATSKDGSIPDHVESSGNIASSFLSQAASLLSKSLGTNLKKVTVPGQVKSLQLAAAAKEKEQQDRDRKAALKEERDQQRRLATIARQQEEDRYNIELAKSSMQVEPERKRREREESTAVANQPLTVFIKNAPPPPLAKTKTTSKSKPAPIVRPDEDQNKKRKIEANETKTGGKKPIPPSRPGSAISIKAPTRLIDTSAVIREPSRNMQQNTAIKPVASLKVASTRTLSTISGVKIAPDDTKGIVNKTTQKQSVKINVLPQPGSEPFIELPDIASEYSDSDEDTQAAKAAKLPGWAQSPALKAALAAQSRIDPDDIFGTIQPLQMEDMFRGRTSRFRARTSSAYWSGADALTRAEEMAYAKRMNYQGAVVDE